MVYAFIDERFRFRGTPRFIAAACIAVPQARFIRWTRRPHSPRRNRKAFFRQDLAEALLEMDGFGVLAFAYLSPTVLRFRDVDATPDIKRMSRTDNAWGGIVIPTVARTLARLAQHSTPFEAIDLYFDRRDLPGDLWHSVAQTLRIQVPDVHREWCDEFGFDPWREISIRRIDQVPKCRRGEAPTKFQFGVNLADQLCRFAERGLEQLQRLEYFDTSDIVREHLQRWDLSRGAA